MGFIYFDKSEKSVHAFVGRSKILGIPFTSFVFLFSCFCQIGWSLLYLFFGINLDEVNIDIVVPFSVYVVNSMSFYFVSLAVLYVCMLIFIYLTLSRLVKTRAVMFSEYGNFHRMNPRNRGMNRKNKENDWIESRKYLEFHYRYYKFYIFVCFFLIIFPLSKEYNPVSYYLYEDVEMMMRELSSTYKSYTTFLFEINKIMLIPTLGIPFVFSLILRLVLTRFEEKR